MKVDQIAALADGALRPWLKAYGFERADVRADLDHDGESSLFVTAHYGGGNELPTGQAMSDAHRALHEALQAEGEERFPYLDHRFGGDEGFDDEADEGARAP